MSTLKLTIFTLVLQIQKIRIMKKMVFVYEIVFFSPYRYSDITLILDANMDTNVSIETHATYNTINFDGKVIGKPI
jgi:heme/copper-type cytochrome/quinol oxidase subunit 1